MLIRNYFNMTGKVNLRTGKIVGCKEDSFAWFHEKAHIIYDDSEKGIINGMNQTYSFYGLLIFLTLYQFINFFKWFSLIMLLMSFYYFFYEEWWCNNYARNKLIELNSKKEVIPNECS